MPALLVHLTLVRQIAGRTDLPPEIARAVRAQPGALLLGAILPDLPYHARFGRQLLRHLLRREYLLSEWGDLFHIRGGGRLALAFFDHLARAQLDPRATEQVLALAAGYLCHHATDRAAHPRIQQLVSRRGHPGEPPSVVHSRIERYQSLFFHLDHLGHDIAGSPYPRQIVGEVAGASLLARPLERDLWRAIRGACLEVHGRAPSAGELQDWLWGVAAYGHLMSSAVGRAERLKGDLKALRAKTYQGPSLDLQQPLEAAAELTLQSWARAAELLRADRLDGEARASFLHHVPDVDLSTGY